MSEMVERVAGAIAHATHIDEPNFEEIARAAIEAMREPDLEMLDAGNRAARQTRVSGVSGMTIDAQVKAQCARENAAWRAMIDAALTE